ncbi:MAG TPA: hypothetical protein VFK61_00145 [Candidatus Limnocylindria bacterium]|nr:hypothetical protein [Candidatus Limnocylindria bacterium]
METLRRELGALSWLVRMAVFGTVAVAVYRELQQPAEKRTWHGKVFNVVPYDFRMPSPARIAKAWWSPRSRKLFNEQPFGVGWVINLPVAVRGLQRMRGKAR